MARRSTSCGAHAGECRLVSNSEGTFCTLSGIETAGPKLVCYNFESAGNRVYCSTSKRTKRRRSEHSLALKSRAMKSINKWKQCMQTLYPTLPDAYAHNLARSLCEWSTTLELCKSTHPAIRKWPMLFVATVTSHMASGGASDRDGTVIVPASAALEKRQLDHKLYKTFGITCRAMSIAWRKLRSVALDEDGMLIPANAFPFDISTCAGDC